LEQGKSTKFYLGKLKAQFSASEIDTELDSFYQNQQISFFPLPFLPTKRRHPSIQTPCAFVASDVGKGRNFGDGSVDTASSKYNYLKLSHVS
jgi:hypothetical protein